MTLDPPLSLNKRICFLYLNVSPTDHDISPTSPNHGEIID